MLTHPLPKAPVRPRDLHGLWALSEKASKSHLPCHVHPESANPCSGWGIPMPPDMQPFIQTARLPPYLLLSTPQGLCCSGQPQETKFLDRSANCSSPEGGQEQSRDAKKHQDGAQWLPPACPSRAQLPKRAQLCPACRSRIPHPSQHLWRRGVAPPAQPGRM